MTNTTNTINLSSIYTPYTLDTYQTFTMEGEEESIVSNYGDGNQALEYDDFDWTYHMDDFLQALASYRLELMQNNLIDSVIINILQDGPATSPKYYNYTTDSAHNNFIVDMVRLDSYIMTNQKDFDSFCTRESWWATGGGDEAKLAYYLQNKSLPDYDAESYYYDMVEGVPAYDYLDYKLIKKDAPVTEWELDANGDNVAITN